MKQCFEVLGLDETATREQIQEAYEQKVSKFSGEMYLEDPKYAKRKLKALKKAYEEAYWLASDSLNELDEEQYMQELYHKHLHMHVDKAAGIYPAASNRTKKQKEADAAYKRNVLLFWIGILGAIILIGIVL